MEISLDTPDRRALYNIACNPETPVDVLTQLMHTNDRYVLNGLISNPNTPSHVLKHVFRLDTADIKNKILFHPNVPDSAFENISEIPMGVLKKMINQHTPTRFLKAVLDSGTTPAKRKVFSLDKLDADLMWHMFNKNDIYGYDLLTSREDVPPELLDLIVDECKDVVILQRIASHPQTSPKTLHKIVVDGNPQVTYYIAAYRKVSDETFEIMLNSKTQNIVFSVARNPHAPSKLLERYLRSDQPNTSNLIAGYSESVLQSVFSNPALDKSVVERVATSNKVDVEKHFVLNSPHINTEMVEQVFITTEANVSHNYPKHKIFETIAVHEKTSNDILKTILNGTIKGNSFRFGARAKALHQLMERDALDGWPQEWVEAHYGKELFLSAKRKTYF